MYIDAHWSWSGYVSLFAGLIFEWQSLSLNLGLLLTVTSLSFSLSLDSLSNPFLKTGAVNAMHDAVVLANCIYNMPNVSRASIDSAFKEYVRQRAPRLDSQYKRSQTMMAVMSGKTWVQRVTRHAMLNYVPKWVQDKDFIKSFEYRPQIAWLPVVPNRGVGKVLAQEGTRELYTDRQDRLKKQYPHAALLRKGSDMAAPPA